MDCNARKTNNKQTNKHIYRYKRNFITDTTLDVISLAFTYTFVISKKMFQIKVSCPHGVNIYVLYIFFASNSSYEFQFRSINAKFIHMPVILYQ